jgi:hypothetical protein
MVGIGKGRRGRPRTPARRRAALLRRLPTAGEAGARGGRPLDRPGHRFDEAQQAVDIGADIIVAQGAEAGGRILDIARGTRWPERYSGRAIRNVFVERWRGKEQELEADEDAKAEFRAAVASGDASAVPVWAGEAIDLITSLSPAADIVAEISSEPHSALLRAGQAITPQSR